MPDFAVAQVPQVDVAAVVFVGIGGQRPNVLAQSVHRRPILRGGDERLRKGLGLLHGLLEQVRKAGQHLEGLVHHSEVPVALCAVFDGPSKHGQARQDKDGLGEEKGESVHGAKISRLMTRHDQVQGACTHPVVHHEHMTSRRPPTDRHLQALALRHLSATAVQQRPGHLMALRR